MSSSGGHREEVSCNNSVTLIKYVFSQGICAPEHIFLSPQTGITRNRIFSNTSISDVSFRGLTVSP